MRLDVVFSHDIAFQNIFTGISHLPPSEVAHANIYK